MGGMVGGRAGKAGRTARAGPKACQGLCLGSLGLCAGRQTHTQRSVSLPCSSTLRTQLLCAQKAAAGFRWLPPPRHLSKHGGDDAREEKPLSV